MKNIFLKVLLFLLLINPNNVFSQVNDNLQEIQILFDKLYFAVDDTTKMQINKVIKIKLKLYVENNRDLVDDLSSIKNLSSLKSDDKDVFLFTWAVKFNNENLHYFGLIKYYNNNDGKYYVDELVDNDEITSENKQSKFQLNNWYGAVYYKIISRKYKKERTYLLLGWDTNDDFTNKKIIDVLYIDKNDEIPIFGKGNIDFNGKKITRFVFEYGERVAMTLTYNAKKKLVIWDHLSPAKQKFKGIYKYYGPDFSFDALQFEKGIWKYIPDIELKE